MNSASAHLTNLVSGHGPVALLRRHRRIGPHRPTRACRRCCCAPGGERILFDCGEGTQQQLLRSVGLPDVDAIFITHFHLDHWLGLIGMVKTFDLRGARAAAGRSTARPGCSTLFGGLRPMIGRTGYPLELVELEPHDEIRFDVFLIAPFPVNHRVEAYGYAFIEDDRPGRFDVEAARALGVAGRARTSAACSAARPSTA